MNTSLFAMLLFLATEPATWNDATNIPIRNPYSTAFIWISAIVFLGSAVLKKIAQKKGKTDAEGKQPKDLEL